MKLPLEFFITHTSPQGREFILSEIRKVPDSEKRMDGEYKSRWIVTVKMLEDGSFIDLEGDYQDNVIKKYKYNGLP